MKKTNQHHLEELSDELSLALGEAVWAFARIEKLIFEYIEKLARDDLNDLIGYQPITKRIEIIKKLIIRIEGLGNEKKHALSNLEKALKLSKSRNKIAHNPWLIWVDLDKKIIKTEIHEIHNKDSVPIDLIKMRKFTADAERVASDLKDSLIPLVKAVRGF